MVNFVNLTSSHFGESESKSVYRQRPVKGHAANPIELSDDEEYPSDTIFLSDSSDVDINNEEEEEAAFLYEEELEEFWSRFVTTEIMGIQEFIYCVANPYTINEYLMSNGVFYNSLRVFLCNGDSGSQMYLDDSNLDRICWRCNGIVDPVTGNRCCNEDVMLVLYIWAVQISRSEIVMLTKLNPRIVTKIISDWFQMIQEDLKDEDCKIGGLFGEERIMEISYSNAFITEVVHDDN
ncbi:hypothetical protein BD770DRAFT_413207 [Pilaira anomala]|nr:hypothetical protein BD770DRAFT_413207 [Pilaira anomala]